MEPIISPWWIYWLAVADEIKSVVCSSAFVFGVGSLVWVIVKLICVADLEYTKDGQKALKASRFVPYVFFISLILAIFSPSQKTLISMIIAKNITPVNIDRAISAGKSVKDELKKDVLDIIREVTKDDGKKEKSK